jgi:hypothetical protein
MAVRLTARQHSELAFWADALHLLKPWVLRFTFESAMLQHQGDPLTHETPVQTGIQEATDEDRAHDVPDELPPDAVRDAG